MFVHGLTPTRRQTYFFIRLFSARSGRPAGDYQLRVTTGAFVAAQLEAALCHDLIRSRASLALRDCPGISPDRRARRGGERWLGVAAGDRRSASLMIAVIDERTALSHERATTSPQSAPSAP